MKIDYKMDHLRGVIVNSDRQVSTDRGLVFDMHTNQYVPGVVLIVGHQEIAVTDEQAERLVQYIKAEFSLDDFYAEREAAKLRHPSTIGMRSERD